MGYRCRIRLVTTETKNENILKYRIVSRFKNKDVITQVLYSSVLDDNVVCSSYAHKLYLFEYHLGLKNYAASYCVGLICARRFLSKFDFFKVYLTYRKLYDGLCIKAGSESCWSTLILILDIGIKRSSTGSRLFAVTKGAIDEGVNMPYNIRRLVGFNNNTLFISFDCFKKYIYAGHIEEYVTSLEEEPDWFRLQFSTLINKQINSSVFYTIIVKVHAAIRTTPLVFPFELKIKILVKKTKYTIKLKEKMRC